MNDKKSSGQSPYVSAYSRFLNLMAAVDVLPGMDGFGVNEKALFEAILSAWSNQTPLTVRQIIGIERLGSPATLHKRLTRLRTMGVVGASSDESDRRTKFLFPTEKGLQYANMLGQACASTFELKM